MQLIATVMNLLLLLLIILKCLSQISTIIVRLAHTGGQTHCKGGNILIKME